MKKYSTKKGFIQIPLFVAIIFVLSLTTAGYLGAKYLNLNKTKVVIEDKKEEDVIQTENKQRIGENISPKLEDNKPIQNTDLKIEQCKAIKEKIYNDAILKLNQVTNTRLEETFNSLNQQYENEVKKINDNTNVQISRITNDITLTGTSKLSLISSYNNSVSEQIKALYDNQQVFWKNQKQEIENGKQKAIDQINLLLSEEYGKCLNK